MTVNNEALLSHVDRLLSTSKSKSFLGREFLTWLWYYVEKSESPFTIKSPKNTETYTIDLWIDDRIVLDSPNGRAHVQTLKGGDPSRSLEAASALLTGKSVKEMRLGFHLNSMGDFTFTLNSQDLSPKSISLPEPSSDSEQDQQVSLLSFRLKATEVLVDIIDGCFSMFLDQRIDQSWQDEGLGAIKKWIRTKKTDLETTLH